MTADFNYNFPGGSQIAGQRVLAQVSNVDMTAAAADSAFVFNLIPNKYIIRRIVAERISGAFGVACAGGIYTATAKGGTAIVAAAQSYAALTGANKFVDCTLAAVAGTDVQTATSLYVNLTTGNTGALVANFYIFGDILS